MKRRVIRFFVVVWQVIAIYSTANMVRVGYRYFTEYVPAHEANLLFLAELNTHQAIWTETTQDEINAEQNKEFYASCRVKEILFFPRNCRCAIYRECK